MGLVCYFAIVELNYINSLEVPHLGLDAAREAAKNVKEVEFEPKDKALDEPKEGKHDDKEHSGGDTYAGGVRFSSISTITKLTKTHRPAAAALQVWVAWVVTNGFTRAAISSRLAI